MRKFLFLLTALVTMFSCNMIDKTFNEELALFVGTRSSEPLEQTVWQHKTDEEHDRFIYFKDGEINLFYGCIENEEIHRYSDYYSSSYKYTNGYVVTNLEYPLWGKRELTEKTTVVRYNSEFILYLDDDYYEFVITNPSTLDDLWMTITVNITPWQW